MTSEETMKRAILTILILVMLAAVPVFARSTYYFPGDQVFSIRAGVNVPAFFSFYNNPERPNQYLWNTHLKLGGFASIAYQGYISETFALGGELSYAFNYSRSNLLLTTGPITAKLTYVPVQTGRFDIAMSLNIGGAFIRYNEGKFFAPYASIALAPSFFFTENWGLGIEGGLMLTAEFYTKNSNKHIASAFAGLMPVTLVLSYRH